MPTVLSKLGCKCTLFCLTSFYLLTLFSSSLQLWRWNLTSHQWVHTVCLTGSYKIDFLLMRCVVFFAVHIIILTYTLLENSHAQTLVWCLMHTGLICLPLDSSSLCSARPSSTGISILQLRLLFLAAVFSYSTFPERTQLSGVGPSLGAAVLINSDESYIRWHASPARAVFL